MPSQKRKYEYVDSACQTTFKLVTPQKKRPSRAKHVTPPQALSNAPGHHTTPQRAGVFLCREIAWLKGITIPQEEVRDITGVSPRRQSEVLKSGEVRRLNHALEPQEPDPRAPLRCVSHEQTQAIYNYLTDESIPIRLRSKPWADVFVAATGEPLPQTLHSNGQVRTVETQTIQMWCRKDQGLGTFKREEEKKLSRDQATRRLKWIDIQLPLRPHSIDWKDCAFCDEFHFGIQMENTKTVKRPATREYRWHEMNVQLKDGITSKEEKEKARQGEHIPLVNIFVIIGFNFKKTIRYKVDNDVGKMTTIPYIQILETLKSDVEWQRQGLILVQDADSAHTSKKVQSWCKKNDFRTITLPGKSPDFSILETLASSYKRRFHAQSSSTTTDGLARFEEIFYEEVSQETIRRVYDGFTARFHEARRRNGQMTHF
jgi:hypothetical protein